MKTDSTKGLISQVFVAGTAVLATISMPLNNNFATYRHRNDSRFAYSYIEYYPSANNILCLSNSKSTCESEDVIPLPFIKKLSVKIKKVTPLKFAGIEDSKGFI